ncbi:TlpA family protein disulfide reductase [Bacillus shivajii]|uniref:TlpA disulfide reductase family protein n=1 Tax=Bacillus shivajii TaxID=1983719 RepID=UPI001CFA05B5|nr:TlpA disulfide reductase family protein [Bacillus shivajii]UCZ54684.1 TlpA family protein disulfide reductase [Bacillus shivajii]
MKVKLKQILTIIIFLSAITIGGYIIYEDRASSPNIDEQLNNYYDTAGDERTGEAEYEEAEYVEKDEIGVSPGMLANNFSLKLFDEEDEVQLSDFQGQFVVLNMWASWCPPCREEMPDLIKFHEDYSPKGNVDVVGINITTAERNEGDAEQFIEDFQIPFKNLMDVDGKVLNDYEVLYMPMTYIIDPDGRVSLRHRGHLTYEMLEDYYEQAIQLYEEGT